MLSRVAIFPTPRVTYIPHPRNRKTTPLHGVIHMCPEAVIENQPEGHLWVTPAAFFGRTPRATMDRRRATEGAQVDLHGSRSGGCAGRAAWRSRKGRALHERA